MRQADDLPLLGKVSKTFHEALIADLKAGAAAFGCAWLGRLAEQSEDVLGKGIAGHEFGRIVCELQIGSRFRICLPNVQCRRQSGARQKASIGHDAHSLLVDPARVNFPN